MALSPDGRFIAYVATRPDGVDAVWLRALDAVDARPLPGTEHAWQPEASGVPTKTELSTMSIEKRRVIAIPPVAIADTPSTVLPRAFS
jgi:hypothetical protein